MKFKFSMSERNLFFWDSIAYIIIGPELGEKRKVKSSRELRTRTASFETSRILRIPGIANNN